MAFQSEAHKKKMAELLKQGKITQATYDDLDKATGSKKLPERVAAKSSKPRSLLRRRHTPI